MKPSPGENPKNRIFLVIFLPSLSNRHALKEPTIFSSKRLLSGPLEKMLFGAQNMEDDLRLRRALVSVSITLYECSLTVLQRCFTLPQEHTLSLQGQLTEKTCWSGLLIYYMTTKTAYVGQTRISQNASSMNCVKM